MTQSHSPSPPVISAVTRNSLCPSATKQNCALGALDQAVPFSRQDSWAPAALWSPLLLLVPCGVRPLGLDWHRGTPREHRVCASPGTWQGLTLRWCWSRLCGSRGHHCGPRAHNRGSRMAAGQRSSCRSGARPGPGTPSPGCLQEAAQGCMSRGARANSHSLFPCSQGSPVGPQKVFLKELSQNYSV